MVDWLVPILAASSACDRPAQASPEQLGGNLELRSERVILGLDLGVGEQAGLELFELDCHVMSFARRSASSISGRGGFCVFFTNAPFRPSWVLSATSSQVTIN